MTARHVYFRGGESSCDMLPKNVLYPVLRKIVLDKNDTFLFSTTGDGTENFSIERRPW